MKNTIYGRTFEYESWKYRDIFEQGIWKRQVYIKRSKEWKDRFVISSEGYFIFNNNGAKRIMYEVYKSYDYTTDCISFDRGDAAFNALTRVMGEIVPAFKYWIAKLEQLGNPNIVILSILDKYKNIPETESLLIMNHRIQFGREYTRWFIMRYMMKNAWNTKTHPERKAFINAYREWCVESDTSTGFISESIKYLPDDVKRTEEIIMHRHEDDFIIIGEEGDKNLIRRGVKVTNRDMEWLKRTCGEENIYHTCHCYYDWLGRIVDNVTDLNDNYFRRQRDWKEQHDRMMEDDDIRIENERNKEREEFKERYSKYSNMILEKDGWRIYISNDIKQWEYRAEVLRQCIIACKYYTNKNKVLIFIDKDNKCRYTAELHLKSLKIGQFYGDERKNSRDLHPTQEVKNLVDEYIDRYFKK